MVQFPPFGGGEAASQAGVVPTVQTTSVKNADNGVLWAKWSAFWAQRCLSWSSPVEWCNRFVSFGVGYALSWSGGSSCPVGWGVSRDLVRMSRLR